MKIGGVEIAPGERRIVDLFAARLYNHSRLEIPVQVVRGLRDGPRLVICAAIHGDEINGVEVIHRVLRMPDLEKKIRGTLVAVPVVNVFGFVQQSRYLPDRRDLNRSFPGSRKGSLASRMARLFLEEVVDGADFAIDLHTGSHDRCNLPQLRITPGHEQTERLARAFGVPVVVAGNARRGTLRDAAVRRGTPMIVYEGGQALRFEEDAIRPGVRGVKRIMRLLGMLPKLRSAPREEAMVTRKSRWIRAPIGGVFRVECKLGSRVRRKEIVGTISDPFGIEETRVRATSSGLIIGRLERPLVHRGDALIHLAEIPRKVTPEPTDESPESPSLASVEESAPATPVKEVPPLEGKPGSVKKKPQAKATQPEAPVVEDGEGPSEQATEEPAEGTNSASVAEESASRKGVRKKSAKKAPARTATKTPAKTRRKVSKQPAAKSPEEGSDPGLESPPGTAESVAKE